MSMAGPGRVPCADDPFLTAPRKPMPVAEPHPGAPFGADPPLSPAPGDPGPVAFIDVHVHYLASDTSHLFRSLRSSAPVQLWINRDLVEFGSQGGRVPVAAGSPLSISPVFASSLASSSLMVTLSPGQVMPLFYTDTRFRNAPSAISLTPFREVPGTTMQRAILIVVATMLLPPLVIGIIALVSFLLLPK